MAGRKTWVESGKKLEVGRTEYADFVFPNDSQMSGRHFALECTGNACVIRDLRSSNGTFVNNQQIESTALHEGDEILAGQTVFTVRFEKVLPVAPTITPTATGIGDAEEPTLHSALMQQKAAEDAGSAAVAAPRRPPDAPITPGVISRAAEEQAGAPSPAGPPAIVKPMLKEPLEWPIDVRNFRPEPGNYAYAVIDAAAVPDLMGHARALGMDLRCLFPDAPEALARVAPHVVHIGSKSNFFHHWADGLGSNAGILLESPDRLEAMFDHCRRVFLSSTQEGQTRFFRFYDPRVLRPYLPTCTLDELTKFFGATHAILVEDENPTRLLRYMPSNAGLRVQVLKVDAASQMPTPTQFAN